MKCPHCHQEIEGPACPGCGAITLESAKHCMECGCSLGAIPEDSGKIIEDDNDLDFENRILCSDDTCTGIMIDGRCSECGKRFADKEKSKKD